MIRTLGSVSPAWLVLTMALLAGTFLPGLSTATVPDFTAAAAADCVGVAANSAAAAGDSAALADSTGTPPAASTAADTVGASRKEFPHPDSTLVPRLLSGGYVIVFRHSVTDWAQRDADGEHFEDRAAQRNLSKEGEAQAARIGKAIAALGIPIGPVLSSPMWRCRDTAQIAFGRHEVVPELFRRGSEYRGMRLAMLSTKSEEKTNMALVTHQDLLIPIVEGLRRDELQEGDALIVKPLGGLRFEIVAQVTPDDWEHLAAAGKAAAVAKDGKAAKGTKSRKTAKK